VPSSGQKTWDQALEAVALNPRHLHQGQHLLTLLRANYHLTHLSSIDSLLQAILDDAVKSLDAQRGAIVLLDEEETLPSLALQAVL
jgi:hypothetical protein